MFKDFFIPKPINTKTPKWMKYINKEKKDYIFNIEEVKKYNIANKII